MMMLVLSSFQHCKCSLSPCYSLPRDTRFKLFLLFENIF